MALADSYIIDSADVAEAIKSTVSAWWEWANWEVSTAKGRNPAHYPAPRTWSLLAAGDYEKMTEDQAPAGVVYPGPVRTASADQQAQTGKTLIFTMVAGMWVVGTSFEDTLRRSAHYGALIAYICTRRQALGDLNASSVTVREITPAMPSTYEAMRTLSAVYVTMDVTIKDAFVLGVGPLNPPPSPYTGGTPVTEVSGSEIDFVPILLGNDVTPDDAG